MPLSNLVCNCPYYSKGRLNAKRGYLLLELDTAAAAAAAAESSNGVVTLGSSLVLLLRSILSGNQCLDRP